MGIFTRLFGKDEKAAPARSEPIVVPMFPSAPESVRAGAGRDGTGERPAAESGAAIASDELRDSIESVLDEVRPYLQGDGGDVELINVNADGTVEMHFVGACHGCPSSMATLKLGIEELLRERIPQIKEVIAV